MRATLTNFRQAPRKVRLAADLVRGKTVAAAESELTNLFKKSAGPLQKLLASAVANAVHNHQADKDHLFIKAISVDKGIVMKRFIPGSHGKAYPIRRASSHITVTLGVKEPKAPKAKTVKTKKK
jgi:large subunit ribosomal protein L22